MANVKANYKINISGNLAELSDDEVEQRTYLANKLPACTTTILLWTKAAMLPFIIPFAPNPIRLKIVLNILN